MPASPFACRSTRLLAMTVAAAIGLGTAAPTMAHTRLVSSIPAMSATASGVKSVNLTFNEAFLPKLSGLEIVMTGMPGGSGHEPMKMTGVKVAASPDKKTLVATLAKALPAGTYDVNWHTVGDDTHRVTGKLSFTVR